MNKEKLAAMNIKTDRIIVRRFSIEDQKDIFEIVSDKDTCYEDGGYEPFKAMDEEFNQLMEKFLMDDYRYVIEVTQEHKVIGLVHLMEVDNRGVDCLEIGYVINKNYRRKGYAFEAVDSVINFCFEEADVEMITAGVFQGNVKSMNMLNKLNFIKEGITHKAMNHCSYGIIDMVNYYKEPKVNS